MQQLNKEIGELESLIESKVCGVDFVMYVCLFTCPAV